MEDNHDYLKDYLEYKKTTEQTRERRRFAEKLFWQGVQFKATIAALSVIAITYERAREWAIICLFIITILAFLLTIFPNKH